jgi:hypothetical protein
LDACDNCTRIDRSEAESRGWTIAPITGTVREQAQAKIADTTATESFGPVDFRDVAAGDRIRFLTNDNGYGGRGMYWRTGTAITTTPKTVTIRCEDGSTARLRAADWSARDPEKAA